ncbi:MAG: hypothetical protein AAF589_07210 [Planctomycetota bacterium]
MSWESIAQLAQKGGPTTVVIMCFLGYMIYDSKQEAQNAEKREAATQERFLAQQQVFTNALDKRDQRSKDLALSGHAAVEKVSEAVTEMGRAIAELSKETSMQTDLLRRIEMNQERLSP